MLFFNCDLMSKLYFSEIVGKKSIICTIRNVYYFFLLMQSTTLLYKLGIFCTLKIFIYFLFLVIKIATLFYRYRF